VLALGISTLSPFKNLLKGLVVFLNAGPKENFPKIEKMLKADDSPQTDLKFLKYL
jgi:hypothetical protein